MPYEPTDPIADGLAELPAEVRMYRCDVDKNCRGKPAYEVFVDKGDDHFWCYSCHRHLETIQSDPATYGKVYGYGDACEPIAAFLERVVFDVEMEVKMRAMTPEEYDRASQFPIIYIPEETMDVQEQP